MNKDRDYDPVKDRNNPDAILPEPVVSIYDELKALANDPQVVENSSPSQVSKGAKMIPFLTTMLGVIVGFLPSQEFQSDAAAHDPEIVAAASQENVDALWNDAAEAVTRHDFERAAKILSELEALSPSPAWILKSQLYRAELLYRDCQESAAFQLWKSILEAAPENAGVKQQIAHVLVEHQNWEKALPIVQQWIAIASDENKWIAKLLLGKVLQNTRKTEETLQYYDQLLLETPTNTWMEREVVWRIAEIYGHRISIQGLLEKFTELRRQLPTRTTLAQSMSQSLLDLQQPRAAIRFCEIAVLDRPLDRELNELLLNRLLALNWLEAAEHQVRVMQQRIPDPDSLTLLLADIYFAQQKQIDYLQILQDYAHRSRHDLQVLHRIARVHRAYDQMIAANAVIQLSIDEHPNSFSAMTYAATWAKDTGDYELAGKRWSAAWSIAWKETDPKYMLELVRGLASCQQYQTLALQFGNRPWAASMTMAEVDELDSYLVDACLFQSYGKQAAETLVLRLRHIQNRTQLEDCWRQAAQIQDMGRDLSKALKPLEESDPVARLLAIELLAREGRLADANQALELMISQVSEKQQATDPPVPVAAVCQFQRIRLARAADDWPTVARLTHQAYLDAVPGFVPTPQEVVHDYLISEQANLALEFIETWKQREPADWRAWYEQVSCLEFLGQAEKASEVRLEAMLRFAEETPTGDPFSTLGDVFTSSLIFGDAKSRSATNPAFVMIQIAKSTMPTSAKMKIFVNSAYHYSNWWQSVGDGQAEEARTELQSLARMNPNDPFIIYLLGCFERPRERSMFNHSFRHLHRLVPELPFAELAILSKRLPTGSTSVPAVYMQRRLEALRDSDLTGWLAWANAVSTTSLRRAFAEHDEHRSEHLRALLKFRTQNPPAENVAREILTYLNRADRKSESSFDQDWLRTCKALLQVELGIRNDRVTAPLWLELLRGRSAAAIPRVQNATGLRLPIRNFSWLPSCFLASPELRDPYRARADNERLSLWSSNLVSVRQVALMHVLEGFHREPSPRRTYDLHQCGIPSPTELSQKAKRLLENPVKFDQEDVSEALVDRAILSMFRGYHGAGAGLKSIDQYRQAYTAVKETYPDLALVLAMKLAKTEPDFETILTEILERSDQAGGPDLKVISAYAKAAQDHSSFIRPPLTPLDRCVERWLWKWYTQTGARVPQIAEQLGTLYGLHWSEFENHEPVRIFLEREMSLFVDPVPLPDRHYMSIVRQSKDQMHFLKGVAQLTFHVPRSLQYMFDYSRLPRFSSKSDPAREIVQKSDAFMQKNAGSFENPRLRLFAAWLLVRDFYYSDPQRDRQLLSERLANLRVVLEEVLIAEPDWAEARIMSALFALQEQQWVEGSRLLEAALEFDLPGDVRWSIDSTLINLAFESHHYHYRPAQIDERIDAAARRALRRSLRYPVPDQVRKTIAAHMVALECHVPLQRLYRAPYSQRIHTPSKPLDFRVRPTHPTTELNSDPTNLAERELKVRDLVCKVYATVTSSHSSANLPIYLNEVEAALLLERFERAASYSADSAFMYGYVARSLGIGDPVTEGYQLAINLEPHDARWRLAMLKFHGYPGRDTYDQLFQEFTPAESPILVDLCGNWFASDALALSEKLHLLDRLLTHIETTNKDLIRPGLAATLDQHFSSALWRLLQIERGNGKSLEGVAQQSIPPSDTSQLIEQLLSRMKKLRPS